MQIYQITNRLTGKRYIGKTHKTPQARWKRHLSDAHRGTGCKVLQRAIHLHGPQSFEVTTLAQFETTDALNLAERLFISEFNTLAPNGYNLTRGGDGGGGPKDEEFRRKISEGMKRHLQSPLAREQRTKQLNDVRVTKTHCLRGHERTPENVYPGGNCKTCANKRGRERYQRLGHR